MKRPLWIVVAVAVLIGAGIGIWQWRKHAAADAAPRFETVAIDRGPITAKGTETGALSALVTVQVATQVSGRIKEIMVDFNSPVKKGQVIARIEPSLFGAALESAGAHHLAAPGEITTHRALPFCGGRGRARPRQRHGQEPRSCSPSGRSSCSSPRRSRRPTWTPRA